MAVVSDLKWLNERVMTGLARFPSMSESELSSERSALVSQLRDAAGASLATVRGDIYLYYLSGLCSSSFWRPIGGAGRFYDPPALEQLHLDVL